MTQHVQKKCELLLMWNQNYSMWKDQSWKIINPKWLVTSERLVMTHAKCLQRHRLSKGRGEWHALLCELTHIGWALH